MGDANGLDAAVRGFGRFEKRQVLLVGVFFFFLTPPRLGHQCAEEDCLTMNLSSNNWRGTNAEREAGSNFATGWLCFFFWLFCETR